MVWLEAGLKIPHWASHYFVILAVYYFAFALLAVWMISAAMYLWEPTSGNHIYAYLPLSWQQNYVLYAAALLYELVWTAWYLATLGTFFCFWCADMFTMNDILASISSNQMTTEDHVKVYRYLQLFCILLNDFSGSISTVGFNIMLAVTPIVYIYLALTVSGLNPLVYLILPSLAFFAVFLIMFLLPQHAKVGVLSAKCVKVLRFRSIRPKVEVWNGDSFGVMITDAKRRIILEKRTRAFKPLGVRIWFFGIYTLHTSQELMVQVLNNILVLLSL